MEDLGRAVSGGWSHESDASQQHLYALYIVAAKYNMIEFFLLNATENHFCLGWEGVVAGALMAFKQDDAVGMMGWCRLSVCQKHSPNPKLRSR